MSQHDVQDLTTTKQWLNHCLNRLERNDPTLDELEIDWDYSSDIENNNTLAAIGTAIGKNKHLSWLDVVITENGIANSNSLFDGLKRNSSIYNLVFCYRRQVGSADCKADCKAIATLLQDPNWYRYSRDIAIAFSDVGLDDCFEIAIKTNRLENNNIFNKLRDLDLRCERIGSVGCEILAALLRHSRYNLHTLNLKDAHMISNEGLITIANELANNTKLKKINFTGNNQIDQSVIKDVFSTLLCNTTSVSDTFTSNHTLESLIVNNRRVKQLESLLQLNKVKNKRYVAIEKIWMYHPNIMRPLFRFDDSDEDEDNLKGLPYVIDWFKRARKGQPLSFILFKDGVDIEKRKLSAIYQFARAMPTLITDQCLRKYKQILEAKKELRRANRRRRFGGKKLELEVEDIEVTIKRSNNRTQLDQTDDSELLSESSSYVSTSSSSKEEDEKELDLNMGMQGDPKKLKVEGMEIIVEKEPIA